MELYHFSGSGFAWRVILACHLKGIHYQEVAVEASPQGLRHPDFLALNPRGKVPVITEGDYTLAESMAIIAYLDREYPQVPLLGRNSQETGKIWQTVLDFDLYTANTLVFGVIAPLAIGQGHEQAESIRAAAEQSHFELAILDAILGNNPWWVGEHISAADIALFPMIEPLLRFTSKPQWQFLELGFADFEQQYPHLQRWREQIKQLSIYEAAYPAYWREMDNQTA